MLKRKHPGRRAPDDRSRAGSPESENYRDRRNGVWIYGWHAVLAAATNPRRKILCLFATDETSQRLHDGLAARSPHPPSVEVVSRQQLAQMLPAGAVHQGVAALAEPLPEATLDGILGILDPDFPAVVVILDQVTDPHNVGAVVRSAAAFAALAVIIQDRHAPAATTIVAKAASGALERVPLVRVVNIARSLDTLKKAGFWCVGLDADATTPVDRLAHGGRVALVLGAEGAGLRRLVRETCDQLVSIPVTAGTESLNVSVAAGIALYQLARRVGGESP
jgi:23S rRNA (guanosine2251-2'-O)-methyltransferase